jgi:hypothetical protein
VATILSLHRISSYTKGRHPFFSWCFVERVPLMGFLSSGGRVESPCCSIQSLQPPFIPSILFFTFHQPTVPKSNISHPSQLNIFIMISNNDENQTQDAPTLPPSEESLQPWPKCSSEWQAQVDRKKDDLFWLQPSQQKLIASLVSGT